MFERFLEEGYTLCVSSDILLEYEEIVSREMGIHAANALMQIMESAPNVERVNTWFRWNLIVADPDDNKFVDCAIACNAKFIVSEDRHFQVLKNFQFLKLNVLKIEEFKNIF